ncbi:hypothetical protein ACT7CZ_18465 [Bacillus cereus]
MLSGYDVFDGKEMKWKCIEKAFGGLETKHKVLQKSNLCNCFERCNGSGQLIKQKINER